MKRMMLLSVAVALVGCSMSPTVPVFSSYEEIDKYIGENYVYISDHYDEWKMPKETIADGGGDCEDLSILFLYMVNESFGVKGELIVSDTLRGCHAWALVDGYEFYKIEETKRYYTLTYDAVMMAAVVRSRR
jgi:hypothetical protein